MKKNGLRVVLSVVVLGAFTQSAHAVPYYSTGKACQMANDPKHNRNGCCLKDKDKNIKPFYWSSPCRPPD